MIRDKIIIVEDDPGISKYLQAALRSHEYDTLLAPDGKTALEMIASHCPDLLLLDLGLPDMDGSEIIRSVRLEPDADHHHLGPQRGDRQGVCARHGRG